jgi:hypothetical protein
MTMGGKKQIDSFIAPVSLELRRPDLQHSRPATVKDGFACQQGDVMGVIALDGLLRRRPLSIVGATPFGTGSTAGSVADGSLFAIGDVLKAFAPVLQVETATVVGTIGASGAGNATVVVTSDLMSSSPKAYAVAVANNDTAALVAGKIRAVLAAAGELADFYDVSGSGANVVLTGKEAAANDASLNISIDNGTCSGLTTEAVSTDTTPGRASLTTIGTILAINGNNITLTSNAAIVAGTGAAISASDGSQVAEVIADQDNDGVGDTTIDVITSSPALDMTKLRGLDETAIAELNGRVVLGDEFNF